jgi:hypothetical protein
MGVVIRALSINQSIRSINQSINQSDAQNASDTFDFESLRSAAQLFSSTIAMADGS